MPSPDVRVLADDDVAALLAAEARTGHEHRGEDVLVADRRADDPAARLLHRVLEPAVGQDRHDEAAAVERVPLEALEREDAEDLVAVDEPARAVDRHAPVRVAVEREPDVGAVLDDGLRERRRVRRAAADG